VGPDALKSRPCFGIIDRLARRSTDYEVKWQIPGYHAAWGRALKSRLAASRKVCRIDLAGFEAKFGMNFTQSFHQTIGELEKEDMLIVNEGNCRLTRKGLVFLDSIASTFICQEIGV